MVGFVDRYVAYRKARRLFFVGWILWIAVFFAIIVVWTNVERHNTEIDGQSYEMIARIYAGCPQMRHEVDLAKADKIVTENEAYRIKADFDEAYDRYSEYDSLSSGRRKLGLSTPGSEKTCFIPYFLYDDGQPSEDHEEDPQHVMWRYASPLVPVF